MKRMITAALAVGVVLGSVGAQADEVEQIGQWFIGRGDGESTRWASTYDRVTDNYLSEYCYPDTGKCIWTLIVKNSCEKGVTYSLLASSNLGGPSMSLECEFGIRSATGHYHYAFSDFDLIDGLIKDAAHIQFSIRVAGGFKVIAFDLRRSSEAVARMQAQAFQTDAPAAAPAVVRGALWDM